MPKAKETPAAELARLKRDIVKYTGQVDTLTTRVARDNVAAVTAREKARVSLSLLGKSKTNLTEARAERTRIKNLEASVQRAVGKPAAKSRAPGKSGSKAATKKSKPKSKARTKPRAPDAAEEGDHLEFCKPCGLVINNVADGITLRCKHIFHPSCIAPLLVKRSRCPTCHAGL